MKKLKRIFDVSLTTLAPLHIATGRELLMGYDYVTHGGRTWFLDAEKMLDSFVDEQGEFDDRILGRPAAELLQDADFTRDNDLFHYVIPGVPRSTRSGAVLREQIKDVYGRPYVPGSSLKGALRTILAWHGFQNQPGMRFKARELNGGRNWAGQGIERGIFGRNPNYDLLRSLHVADSKPIGADSLRLVNAQVVTGAEKFGSPIEAEAVWSDTSFQTTIAFDLFLRTQAAETKLGFGPRNSWLDDLPSVAQAWGMARLQSEAAWFNQRKYVRIAQLYTQMAGLLAGNKLGKNRFFIQLGWGGGYDSKTISAVLRKDTQEWDTFLDNRRLSPARMRRRRGDAFPKSRRVMVIKNVPVAPFGWCLVDMKERE